MAKGGTVKGMIKEKNLVQVSHLTIFSIHDQNILMILMLVVFNKYPIYLFGAISLKPLCWNIIFINMH